MPAAAGRAAMPAASAALLLLATGLLPSAFAVRDAANDGGVRAARAADALKRPSKQPAGSKQLADAAGGLMSLMSNTGWSALVRSGGAPAVQRPMLDDASDAKPFPCPSSHDGGCAQCRKVRLLPGDATQIVCVECRKGRVLVEVPSFDRSGTLLGTRQRCARYLDERSVVAMRHAESEWNHVLHKYMQVPIVTGMFMERWKDSPLSHLGLRQAQRLALTLWEATSDDEAKNVGTPQVGSALEDLAQVPGGLEDAVPVWRLRQATSNASGSGAGDSKPAVAAVAKDASDVAKDKDASGDAEGGTPVRVATAMEEAQQREDGALDVLLGRACDSTEVVTSNLCRSMDTALIALLPLRAQCPEMRWHVSSNLQETEVNIDCEPNLEPCHKEEGYKGAPDVTVCPKPVTTGKQVQTYKRSKMSSTLDYVKESYANIDTSRNLQSMQLLDRSRNNFEHYKMMLDELRWMFKREGTQNFVWSVHSIWLRRLLTYFADRSDPSCRSFAKHKMENTAVVAFDVLKLSGKDAPGGRAPRSRPPPRLDPMRRLTTQASNHSLEYIDLTNGGYDTPEEIDVSAKWGRDGGSDGYNTPDEIDVTLEDGYNTPDEIDVSAEFGSEDDIEEEEEEGTERLVVRNCRPIYLGLAKDFKMQRPTTWETSESFVPTWEDFSSGILEYVTDKAKYKCCCSLPSMSDFDMWSKAALKSYHLGTCKVAEVAKCGNLNAGNMFFSKTRWHSYDKTFLGQCFKPTVCVPEFSCEDTSHPTLPAAIAKEAKEE